MNDLKNMDNEELLVRLVGGVISGRESKTDLQTLHDEVLSRMNGEWVSVETDLPKAIQNGESDYVLGYYISHGVFDAFGIFTYNHLAERWNELWSEDDHDSFTVTHWMPLPQSPKGE